MTTKVLVTFKSVHQVSTTPITVLGGSIVDIFTFAPIVVANMDDLAIMALRNDPSVLAVEPDGTVEIAQIGTGEFASAAPTVEPESRAPWGITKVRAAEVHARGIKGIGVKVAVIDTGIDFNHLDLAAIYKGGTNFVTPGTPPLDDNSHGTHCAGTVSAILDGQGIFGVAPSIDLFAVKVLNAAGSGSWSAVISAYQWCVQNGMHVTNNSYGGSAGSVALETALNAAVDAGILMIFAAGNNGVSVLYPAKYAKAIAVSATDQTDAIASFSSRGQEIAVAAPGVGVESTVLNGMYGLKSGTSMACPHVAGACALALSNGFTAAQVRARITTTLPDKGAPGRDPLYGWGLLDAFALVFGSAPDVPSFRSPVTLDGSMSSDPDGTIVGWSYMLSDGRNLRGVSHVVVFAPGNHSITLTVTDNLGGLGVVRRDIVILADPPPPPPPPPNQLPTARFTMNGA